MSLRAGSVLSFALLAAGCSGRVVNLGGSQKNWAPPQGSPEYWAPPEGAADAGDLEILYRGGQEINSIAVDETNLYFIYATAADVQIRSCALSSCGATLTTLGQVRGNDSSMSAMILSEGELFFRLKSSDGFSLGACPTSGCPEGPRLLTHDADGFVSFAADADYVYWLTKPGLVRCSRGGCTTPDVLYSYPQQLSYDVGVYVANSARVVAAGEYLYFCPPFTPGSIMQIARDGRSSLELARRSTSIGDIAVGPNGLYLAMPALTGQILRCPVGGCPTDPDIVAANQRWPVMLQADADGIYWANSGGPSGGHGSVATCAHDGCSDPKTIASNLSGLESIGRAHDITRFTVNSRHVYWVEDSSALRAVSGEQPDWSYMIRRASK